MKSTPAPHKSGAARNARAAARIRTKAALRLSRRDSRRFARALLNPPAPPPRLSTAARRYLQHTSKQNPAPAR
ncbi:MAG: DUF1778 domain-containing protein [Verrucomicrobiota bacterium]